MTRAFLDEDAQARFSQARIDAIGSIGKLAERSGAEFVLVAGDVFETNRVRPRTVGRALEAMAAVGVPIFLLPGNHDPLDAATVYRSKTFEKDRPPNVHVFDSHEPRVVRDGVEVVGMPWTSKRLLKDHLGDLCSTLEPEEGLTRIVVGHGQVGAFGEHDSPVTISVPAIEAALASRAVAYVALGDRHSTTKVGETGRIWYSGAPEPTAHDEVDPGNALVVELDEEECRVAPERVGTWTFLAQTIAVDDLDKLDVLKESVRTITGKGRTVARLSVSGVVSVSEYAALTAFLEEQRATFASIELWEPTSNLIVRPDDDDFLDLALRGFAKNAVDRIRVLANGNEADAGVARDALAILVRLASGGTERGA
jgi:DNA repair exonuclease SbcCD nuclease subunit